MLRQPFPRSLVIIGTIANFVLAGHGAILIVFLVREVGLTGGLVGLLFTLGAVGALAGSLLASRLAGRFGDAVIVRRSSVFVAGAGLLMPLTVPGWGLVWFVVGQLLMTASIAVFNVCVRAALQIGTPADLLGRTGTSIRLFSRGALPLGAIAGGALATALSARATIAILMSLMLLIPLLLRGSPLGRVRRVRELVAD